MQNITKIKKKKRSQIINGERNIKEEVDFKETAK